MVEDITKRGLSASDAALAHGVSAVTARKWLARFLTDGVAGLTDKSSRPSKSLRAIRTAVALTIAELRRKLFTQSLTATYPGVSKATVSRTLRRAGLSRFSDLAPVQAVQRYEREAPGDLLQHDYLFIAVDDHARVVFTAMRPDERKDSAGSFLREAVAYFAKLGVSVRCGAARPDRQRPRLPLDGVW